MLETKDLEMITEIMTRVVGPLQENMEALQRDITGIKVTLENEVKTGINIIGEGHIDLNRKLDQALENKEERELMKLRILSLENEIRRIKEKLEIA